MAEHKSFTMTADLQVYLCGPQSPWQGGSNENTNGLSRQYLPKKANLSCYSQPDLDEIELCLNQRRRKTWDFKLRRIDAGQCSDAPLRSRGFSVNDRGNVRGASGQKNKNPATQ
jgi:hypothetical protein